MPNTNELACKIMHKLESRGLVKPGTLRVIIDIDTINGLQQHSFSKNEGPAAKGIADGVFALLDKYVPSKAPKSAPKPPPAPENETTTRGKKA